ncbi:RluA family pseudouridine synthase [Rhodopirellula halodulae]|uniref:RluA family pseudouridine synthase n=1 Tax=Rhodopirellula halodulae TaxID=2894198 RepID=UPI001E3B34AC|nr:RluA family pseudouridine synthase [Rhodopirellula sp. JC737]MCC9655587.1 RluA family pseudouridine synthase [Rhodopirellula sp. JC737]
MIEIVWQTEACLVANKPAGLSTTSPPGTDSLESCLREQLRVAKEPCDYLTAVHRLDRPVSGLVLLARRKKAARLLSEQFRVRSVRKLYVAEVVGDARSVCDPGVWTDYLAKVPEQARGEVVSEQHPNAKHAETRVSCLSFDSERNVSRLELRPVTGRMHQLRIQCAHRGNAMVGDSLYGEEAPDESQANSENPLHLVSAKLEFRDPTNGRAITVELPTLPF